MISFFFSFQPKHQWLASLSFRGKKAGYDDGIRVEKRYYTL